MKAQATQLFTYITAAVVAGLILIIGYWGIMTISQPGPVDNSPLKNLIDRNIAQVAKQYGSVKKMEFALDREYDEICFIDSLNEDGTFDGAVLAAIPADYPFIQNKVENDVRENVFLLKEGEILGQFYVESLDVENDFLCESGGGQLEFWLRGTGKTAELYTQ